MTAVLWAENLSVARGKVPAVRNVSLRVDRGSIVTVLGPNGAGKTTLLNALMGLLPSRGRICLHGREIQADRVENRVSAGLSLVAEQRELFSEMSVADNLVLGAYVHRFERSKQRADAMEAIYARFPRLKERRGQRAGTLSGGERQMLAIARALLARPSLLMLDEPSLGLAPLIVREIFDIVTSLRRNGVSILIVEQNARAALQIADYGYVLESGVITMEGTADMLNADQRLIEAYLGLCREQVTIV